MKVVHTYKDLRKIAGNWVTVDIINNYVTGSNHFKLFYKGETVLYQNNDIKNVAICSSQYNGLGWKQLMQFNPDIQIIEEC